MSRKPLILTSNDDGVQAAGNVALREALAPLANVITVAPEREQSANSHSITLHRPLRHRGVTDGVHAIDGTPADCIYVALYHGRILEGRPDLVVSGINHGPNLGGDIFYSGTVAAAREAALRGIPSIAFSLWDLRFLDRAAWLARKIVERFLAHETAKDHAVLLNVNFPACEPKGIRATRLGRRIYEDEVTVRQDPRGREYFWIGGPGARHEPAEGSDTEAMDQGYVSVTPLLLHGTNAEHFGIAAHVAEVNLEER